MTVGLPAIRNFTRFERAIEAVFWLADYRIQRGLLAELHEIRRAVNRSLSAKPYVEMGFRISDWTILKRDGGIHVLVECEPKP